MYGPAPARTRKVNELMVEIKRHLENGNVVSAYKCIKIVERLLTNHILAVEVK